MIALQSENVVNGSINLQEIRSGKYDLHSFIFTNNLYNITNNNNLLPLHIIDTEFEIYLTPSYYNGNDLATHLQTEINNETGHSFVVNYDANAGKFTFTNSVEFYFRFGDYTTNTCEKVIGFTSANTTSTTNQTSAQVSSLASYKCLYIRIGEDSAKCVKNETNGNYSLIITKTGDFGDNVIHNSKECDVMTQSIDLKETNKISIKFYDENNNELTINNWMLILIAS